MLKYVKHLDYINQLFGYWLGGYNFNQDGSMEWLSSPDQVMPFTDMKAGEPNSPSSHFCMENLLEPISGESYPIHSGPSTSAHPAIWNETTTKILIAEMKASEDISNKGKITKKKMFKNIIEQLSKQGYNFSWERVQGKWKTLVSVFERTKDYNNKLVNDRKTCAFQNELEQILEGNPSIKPVAISSSSIFSVKRKSSSEMMMMRKMII
ncbi:unnamed protein product [Mytilus coruscus]|uniref:Myb/SANT-like DNA-binding domain-containing protein n=1 Tax=Mytilus coruscus TaxID=42192 RepID=A0A6J8DVJ0_MYTCO|nr:unnamed protein product [Mytilus coruscus]